MNHSEGMNHTSENDPLLSLFKLEKFERVEAGSEHFGALESEVWVGYDLHKLWLKTELDWTNGSVEEAEVQLLVSRGISTFWDIHAGLRRDFEPESQHWAVVSVEGVAPYFIETEGTIFVGESGQLAARLQAEQEWLITQQWILSPEMELDFYAQRDLVTRHGSGLAEVQFGLRLRYEIRREFAPYVGVNWVGQFGETADFARANNKTVNQTQIVLGLRVWF